MKQSTNRVVCALTLFFAAATTAVGNDDAPQAVRVFIFAGQSNMEGADSKATDIKRFPPFNGLDKPQEDVRFSYCIGRKNKLRSDGWKELQPVNNMVGPELSFAREVSEKTNAPIAIIKCAAGGTHLGGDWNPEQPSGFAMYPLALELVRDSLRKLDEKGVPYRLEGFMWHQGENDMFNAQYMADYGDNLAKFIARWRRDLQAPKLRFYIGELCTKTIWGMDLRPRMYAISKGQKAVAAGDPLAEYVPTSHVGVEIGRGVGLHYHYGTLGQLEHGVNYANAYLQAIGKKTETPRPLKSWPYREHAKLKLFILAGHRNMEGERAFLQQVKPADQTLLQDDPLIAFKYDLGGGYKTSKGWEPLGLTGYYDTFGPELSMVRRLKKELDEPFAVAKFTHSGSQINDWTPEGSMAKSRHIYPGFIAFIKQALRELRDRGHDVELAGVFYHVGENDMSMPPYRKQAAKWLQQTVTQSRVDLEAPKLDWFVSQQPPTDDERVNKIDVTGDIEAVAKADPHFIHIKAFDLPPQEKKLVLNTDGVLRLGELLADRYLSEVRDNN